MPRCVAIVLCAGLLAACGGKNNPATPTPVTTTTTVPAVTLYTIMGTVTGAGAGGLGNANVRVDGGASSGQVVNADGSGHYSIGGLRFEGFTITASAPGYLSSSRGSMLTPGVTTATANFSLLPAAAFSKGGSGDTVFDIPSYVTRLRVQADYGGLSSNFIVRVAGRLVVNELLGTYWKVTHFDGTYLIAGGGIAEITDSSGVSWSFAEVR